MDVTLDQVAVGDILFIYPHEVCPADGVVVEGHGRMNEAFLTGEPFEVSKAPGSKVISGALNGETVLTILDRQIARRFPVCADHACNGAELSSGAPSCAALVINWAHGIRPPQF